MEQIIFHIDCNSAFLSWTAIERLQNGETIDLRTIPSIIGGDQKNRRGVVLAKSIPAKAYGIQTGEPVTNALRKCPLLQLASPDHSMYRRHSQKLMTLLRTFTDDLEPASVDETYMDFTPISHNYDSPIAAAHIIKDTIYKNLGFTVNIGIAPNKLLAKMASDFQKPNQVHTLFLDEIASKMWPMPVGELYMVGKASESKLHSLGIRTIGDLAAMNPQHLILHFKSHGKTIWRYANGFDSSPVVSSKREAKGIGNSTTLSHDIEREEDAQKVLLSLSESVASRLRTAKQLAKTIAIEIKYNDFTSYSHQSQFLSPTNTTDILFDQSCDLFKELWNGTPIRLLGIRTTNLLPEGTPIQMNLFDYQPEETKTQGIRPQQLPDKEKMKNLDAAIDSIKTKYGTTAITRGHHPKPTQNSPLEDL